MDKKQMREYKLEFEVVTPIGRGAQFYTNDSPNCKPADVPDEFWHLTSKQTTDPWDQYNTLKQWAATGEQLIRNVKLFEATIQWTEWTPPPIEVVV